MGDLTFLTTGYGRPFVKEGFGYWFREACTAAKCPGSAYGLRKAGAVRAAENGATVPQLMAIFGWTTEKMAALHTRVADRKRLGMDGAALRLRDQSQNEKRPHRGPVRALSRNPKINQERSIGNWCPEEDSNLHNFRYTDLNRARLPIPPSGRGRMNKGTPVPCQSRDVANVRDNAGLGKTSAPPMPLHSSRAGASALHAAFALCLSRPRFVRRLHEAVSLLLCPVVPGTLHFL
jgi:hypothetical protein